jgi:dihydroxy-acid dehydratase
MKLSELKTERGCISVKKGETQYGDPEFAMFLRKAFARHMGFSEADFEKPIIGICNTESEVNRCHTHFGPMIEAIKRGVLMEGGLPLEFPTISLGEVFTAPTAMLYRNLAAMDTEEMIKAQPFDGVVLTAGCDKTTPAALMGAASADLPAILITGGPMANGEYEGRTLGAGTDARFFWQEYRSGRVCAAEMEEINQRLCPTPGHCMVMGSASTYAVIAEAMGMMLPGTAAITAPDVRRMRLYEETGRQAVRLAKAGIRPSQIMTRDSIENAIRAMMAVGGSTNAVVHVVAIAGRLGIDLPLSEFDRISKDTPFLANLRPAGKYQMEDFAKAGGVPALFKELEHLINGDALTVTGKTVKENLATVKKASDVYRDIIYSVEDPLYADGGIAILKGTLAPRGCVVKPKAATNQKLLQHRGKAVVFSSMADLEARIDDPNLEVTADSILVLQNAGPVGAPGMPEAGMLPIPKKLLEQGVRDMVRISDARMSGTAFGTVVLHVCPEAAVGGPLALVRDGDEIELDTENRRIDLLVSEEELARRRAQWNAPAKPERGYTKMYVEHVLQADEGADFDFLRAVKKK